MKNPLVIITGPTASGKTDLAISMAKEFGGEIVNADSRTIYRGMDIATDKPTSKEMEGIPHHLFDIVEPDQSFSVAVYKKKADEIIAEIWGRGKIPFLVGGTGLYIDSVAYDFNLTETGADEKLRQELETLSEEELAARLQEMDPISADKIDLNNKRRVIRALEVSINTGKTISEQQSRKPLPASILYLAIDQPREELYEKINKRIDRWLPEGLVAETKNLITKYGSELPSMSAIGYQEIGDYLRGEITEEEAIETMKRRTRNYAKRQLSWLRRNKDIVWIKNEQQARGEISLFLA